ncbi:MAG: hypothetical protein ABIH79_02940 [archaeon]
MGVWTARNIYKENCLEVIKMWDLFGHKKKINKLREDIYDSFNHVKKDFSKVGDWIKHLDDKHKLQRDEISNIKDQLMMVHEDLMELKNFVSFFGPRISKEVFKQQQTSVVKQPVFNVVQTAVQTAVQTDILENFTVMERGIIWALLNSDMKLSYEDLAALLGKDKSTIRGQINGIKQKNEGLIKETREINGKKRLYVPEEVCKLMMKSVKVRVKREKS